MYYLSLDGCGWVQTQRFLRCDSGRACGMMDHDGHDPFLVQSITQSWLWDNDVLLVGPFSVFV